MKALSSNQIVLETQVSFKFTPYNNIQVPIFKDHLEPPIHIISNSFLFLKN
jgi:hypothetical protein